MIFYKVMLFEFLKEYFAFGIFYTIGFVSYMIWSDSDELLEPKKILFSLFFYPIEIARTIYYIFTKNK